MTAPVRLAPAGSASDALLAGDPELSALLAPYENVRDRDLRGRDRRFVVEGERVVRRFLRSRWRCESLLLSDEVWTRLQPAIARRDDRPHVFVSDDRTLAEISGYRIHGGCLAIGARDRIRPDATRVFDSLPAEGPSRVLVAEGVVHVDNLGAIFRNAACFGADAVLLDDSCADPLLRKTIRFSMGRVFDVAWGHSRDLVGDLRALRARDMAVCAIELDDRATALADVPRRDRVALVLGGEATGVSARVRETCDAILAIPAGPPDEDGEARSLNVGVASAVALYELSRRR